MPTLFPSLANSSTLPVRTLYHKQQRLVVYTTVTVHVLLHSRVINVTILTVEKLYLKIFLKDGFNLEVCGALWNSNKGTFVLSSGFLDVINVLTPLNNHRFN